MYPSYGTGHALVLLDPGLVQLLLQQLQPVCTMKWFLTCADRVLPHTLPRGCAGCVLAAMHVCP